MGCHSLKLEIGEVLAFLVVHFLELLQVGHSTFQRWQDRSQGVVDELLCFSFLLRAELQSCRSPPKGCQDRSLATVDSIDRLSLHRNDELQGVHSPLPL